MTNFDHLFAAVGTPALLSQWGEALVFYPVIGVPRQVRGMVTRHVSEQTPGLPYAQTVGPHMEIELPNCPRTGITSAELDTGGAMILVALREGATDATYGPQKRPITKLLDDASGLTKIEVR